mmetsp:Transcript_26694/g.58522  ORF Transcript_26694/g.58522 Transcript_26694/m.58522 type:complete len:214 (+) Transcript_26694:648-1289(+)
MDNDGTGKLLSFFLRVRGVLEVEPDRELEIKLNGGTLMDAIHGIHDLDIDLGPVEGTVSGVDLPVALSGKDVHGFLQGCLGPIPESVFSEGLLWPGGELQFVGHAENLVGELHKVQGPQHLGGDLIVAAENVTVVLLEASHTGQTGESTGKFVSVQHTEIGVSDGQIAIGSDLAPVHEAVTGAVHGFHGPFLSLDLEGEHVVLVVQGVAGLVP